MPKVCYIEKRFGHAAGLVIAQANAVIAGYVDAGYRLTLRQLYYQFVARDLFPEERRWTWDGSRWKRDPEGTKNAEPNYKWLGGLLNDARLAGLVDWNAIEDRTRQLKYNNHWEDPADLLAWAADGYGFDKWRDQPERVEVWVEKEALAGVVERPSNRWDVSWFCCRGYVSQSELWRAAQRLAQYRKAGQVPTVIYLGDHDPSGVDMSRDIFDRMELFVGAINVERIALNMDQIEELDPPPSPAKLTDSRAGSYIERYGDESWELDALDVEYLDRLIDSAILVHVDLELFEAAQEQQEEERNKIRDLGERWDDWLRSR